MFVQKKLTNLQCFFLFLSAAQSLFADEARFEDQYALEITSCRGRISPPSIFSDLWDATISIHFDNNLRGTYTTYLNHESQVKDMASIKYSGKVNILKNISGYKKPFLMILENDYSLQIDLSINSHNEFGKLSVVESITENIETSSYDQVRIIV